MKIKFKNKELKRNGKGLFSYNLKANRIFLNMTVNTIYDINTVSDYWVDKSLKFVYKLWIFLTLL